jgi:predicted metalloendopeptidase
MEFVASRVYLKNDPTAERIRNETETIAHYVRTAVRDRLQNVTWMDDPTRKKALQKESNLKSFLGYPEWMTNTSKLMDRYFPLRIDIVDHFNNAIHVHQFQTKYRFKHLNDVVDPTDWAIAPHITNAYYDVTLNAIVFPTAMLQPPFLLPHAPLSHHYGAVGHIMAHEITHGFDAIGRQYDAHGQLNSWWSAASEPRYKNMSQCFIDQYATYDAFDAEDKRLGRGLKAKVNSRLTLAETLSDNGGLQVAWKAWLIHRDSKEGLSAQKQVLPGLQKFSDEQLFFIGMAQQWCQVQRPEYSINRQRTDPHPPNKIRVNGAVSNFEPFARAFQCKSNAPMNPAHKCTMW